MPAPYITTLSVAPVTNDLTILETVKEELDITDNDNDALLARLISEQSEVAAAYCRRPLSQATVIDNFRIGSATDAPLLASRWPITSIETFIDGATELTSSDYEYDETGLIWRLDTSGYRACWTASSKVTITYVGGYELLTTLPRDIERAVLILIKESWFARTRDPSVRSETVDGIGRTDLWVGTVPGGGALPQDATMLLQPYRRYVV